MRFLTCSHVGKEPTHYNAGILPGREPRRCDAAAARHKARQVAREPLLCRTRPVWAHKRRFLMARAKRDEFPVDQLNQMQRYLGEEMIEDYHEGQMTRREMLRRLLGICGSGA